MNVSRRRLTLEELPLLPDVKGKNCPKCDGGGYNSKLKYCESDLHADVEHIHITCSSCGYERLTKCFTWGRVTEVKVPDLVEDVRNRAATATATTASAPPDPHIAAAFARAGDDAPQSGDVLGKALGEAIVTTTE